jgi:RNA polymerase sigma factor (sigma-70 family)
MEANQIPASEMDRANAQALRQAEQMARTLPPHVDTAVLENEALFAVWWAAQRFSPDRGASFATWSVVIVRNRLLEEVRRQSPYTRLQRQRRRECFQAGRDPEPWMLPPLDLFTPVGQRGNEHACVLADVISTCDEAPRAEARALVAQLLAQLEPRRREVVERYFLLGESTTEIAASMGVSVSRVQQFKEQALAALQVAVGIDPASLPKRAPRRKKAAAAEVSAP